MATLKADKCQDTGILYLVPDMPSAEEVLFLWKMIDKNRWYTNFGPLEQRFRQTLASDFFGVGNPAHVALASSGTSALYLALLAHRFPPRGKIIMPAFTFPATAIAAIKAGLTPVFMDVDANLTLNPDRLAQALLDTGACGAVPLCWHSHHDSLAMWDQVAKITHKSIIVDAAPALEKHRLPQHCTYVFSLHATKQFGIGEGGAVIAPDEELIQSVRKLSNFDFENGQIEAIGDNAKLSEYHAAVGLAQISRYEAVTRRRAQVISYYQKLRPDFPAATPLISDLSKKPAYMLVQTKHSDANTLCDFLRAHKVGCRQLYCPPLNLQPAFRHVESIDPLTHTNRAAYSTVALPFHNDLRESDVIKIVRLLQQFSQQHISLSTSIVHAGM